MRKKTLILTILISILFSFLQIRTSKALTVSDVIVSFTPPYGTVHHIQTDSDGNIYYGNELGNIYKSADGGSSWTVWFNEENASSNYVYMILPASTGDFFVQCQGTGNPIWKYNGTWTSSYAGISNNIWHYDEMSNGTLIMNPYGTTHPDILYATDDSGENWRQINLTTLGFTPPWHIHSVRVNPYNDDVWVALGDTGNEIQLIKYNLTGWFLMGQGLQRYWKTDFTFDSSYVYFLSDTTHDKITRISHDGNVTIDQEDVLRSDQWTGGTHFGKYMREVDGLLFASTRHGTVWSSWDGEHWIALVDNDASSGYAPQNFGWYRSNDNAIISCDSLDNKIYKFYVDEATLKHLFFKDSVTVSGSSLTINQILKSGSDSSIDLGEYGISDATIKLTGTSHNLIASNGTFESGALSGWYERWNTISITSSEHYAGSYALNFTQGTKGVTWLGVRPPEFHNASAGGSQQGFKPRKGWIYVISLYGKSNVSSTDAYAIQCYFKNESGSDQQTTNYLNPLGTTWKRYQFVYVCPNSYDDVNFAITNKYASGQELYIDNFLVEYHEAQTYDSGGLDRQYLGGWVSSMFTSNQTTTNPSVTIDGTTKSHSGILANQTDTTSTSISLSSGSLDVTTSVTGSELVEVTIMGTISHIITNGIIKNEISSGLYNGSYFGSLFVSGGMDLIIFNDENTSITTASLVGNQLTFTVSGYSALSSQTKVYLADKGKPLKVDGADSWTWDPSGLLTLSITHESSRSVSISWSGGATSSFKLRVHVSKNKFPYLGAIVNVDGENKSTNLFGDAYFDVGVGSCDITVYLEDQIENREIFVSRDQSVGFNFDIPVPTDRSIYIFISIPLVFLVVFGVFFFLWRRK